MKLEPRRRQSTPKTTIAAALDVVQLPPASFEAPVPLENEPPHRVLARANARHAKLTEELRALKSQWTAKNIKAQQCRQPIPTPEITHVETRRRELQSALMETQAEIARINKLIREHKVVRQAGKPLKGDAAQPKRMPLGDDPEFPAYFVLVAKTELAPSLYAQVERIAKAMLRDGQKMGEAKSLQTPILGCALSGLFHQP